jgi:hypothetical protein
MYFRQVAEAAVSAKGVWLQTVFAFARETGQIDNARYADAAVKLAWRRHSHVSIDPRTLLDALKADDTADLAHYSALTEFIGTKNAEMRSHLDAAIMFFSYIWANSIPVSVKTMKATSILLGQLIRHQQKDWALILALLKDDGVGGFPDYVDGWVRGHFLPAAEFSTAEMAIAAVKDRLAMRRAATRLSAAPAIKKRSSRESQQRSAQQWKK